MRRISKYKQRITSGDKPEIWIREWWWFRFCYFI